MAMPHKLPVWGPTSNSTQKTRRVQFADVHMFLDAAAIPDLMRLVTAGSSQTLKRIDGAEISLTACLFLALACRNADAAFEKTSNHGTILPQVAGLRSAIRCLNRREPQISLKPFGAPSFDLYRISSRADLLSEEWILFYDRFYRSTAGGRNSRMLKGVSGVLAEMGDNVVWHSTSSKEQGCLGIAGFHISGDAAAFCVTDHGQGFLNSLRRSPRWSHLKTEDDALSAIVYQKATSRLDEKTGGGFTHLFENLLDFNGLVILRSGNCTYRLDNSKGLQPRLTKHMAGVVPGSSVTVVIGRGSHVPAEKPLNLT